MDSIFTDGDDTDLDEHRTVGAADMKSIFEDDEVRARPIADPRLVETQDDAAAVAERQHIGGTLQVAGGDGWTEDDVGKVVGAEAGVGARDEGDNFVRERITRRPHRKRRPQEQCHDGN